MGEVRTMRRLTAVLVLAAVGALCCAPVSGGVSAVSGAFTLDLRFLGTGTGGGWAPYLSGDNRPVVLLVRGLRPIGGPEDPLDYWSSMNAHLITQLPGARVIAVSNGVFDGTGTVSAAGARLKGWVEAYASGGLVDVYIVAHSMGGLVTRSCLSQMGGNRSWVRGVVMLGTPNAGTAVADTLVAVAKIGASAAGVPGQALALGFEVFDPGRCQAIRDLRTSAVTSMSRSWGDSGYRYSLLAGTYGGGDATYRIGSAILDNPNDGRVTRTSAWGGGMLPSAAKADKYLNHTELKNYFSALDYTAEVLKRTARSQGQSPLAGFGGGQGIELAAESEGEPEVLISAFSDSLAAGQTKDYPVPVDVLSEGAFSVTSMGAAATVSLVRPGGAVLTPTAPGPAEYTTTTEGDLTQAVYRLASPEPGAWNLRVLSPAAATIGGTAAGRGWLTLQSTTAPLQSSGSCWVTASLSDAGNPVTGATVTAGCMGSEGTTVPLTLLDDGAHGDGAAADGVYGARLTGAAPDQYTVSLSATGQYGGNAFSRLASGTFTVSPETAQLVGGCTAQPIDTGGGPAFEKLRVTTTLRVLQASSFRLSASLVNGSGQAVASSVVELASLSAGDHAVGLDFDGDAIRRAAVTGDLTLGNAVVTDTGREPELDVAAETSLCAFAAPDPQGFCDTTAPDSVPDLAVDMEAGTSVTLSWSAPSSEGQAAFAYDLRVSEDGFSYSSWAGKPSVSPVPVPGLPGVSQTATVTGLVPGRYYWFCLRSVDSAGNLSNMSNLVWSGMASAYSPATPVGGRARFSGIVTAVFSGLAYVEKVDRSGGLAVEMATGDILLPGALVDAMGDVAEANGERRLANTFILPLGQTDVPAPLVMRASSVGGPAFGQQGCMSTGLLVRVAGRVTDSTSGFIYVDDGSACPPGQVASGVRVLLPSGVAAPAVGSWVDVTGISSSAPGTPAVPAVRIRDAGDLQVISTP